MQKAWRRKDRKLTMEASVTGNGVLFFWAILLGAVWGVVYDMFRVIRIARGASCPADNYAAVKRLRAVRLKLPELNRSKRKKGKPEKSGKAKLHITETALVFIEDLLFTLACGLSFIIFVFSANSGMFRWFLLVGAAAGFCAYYFTVGKLVTGCAALLVALIRAVLILIGNYTLCPFLRLMLLTGRLMYRLAAGIGGRIQSRYRTHIRRRYTAAQSRRLEIAALHGFRT